MARRGRRKQGRMAGEVTDPTVAQIQIDFTVEQKAEAFDEAGDLWSRMETLKAEALAINVSRRALGKKLTELHRQASAGKRTVEVETYERVDPTTNTVRIINRATDEEISFRRMTEAEIAAGVAVSPAEAARAFAEVAAVAGEGTGPASEDADWQPASTNGGSSSGDQYEEPAPEISADPSIVASVHAAAGLTGAHA